MSMTTDQSSTCSQETMGAEDSNNQGLKALKTMPSMLPHLVNVINRCSQDTRIEIKEELLDYLDEIQEEKQVEVDEDVQP